MSAAAADGRYDDFAADVSPRHPDGRRGARPDRGLLRGAGRPRSRWRSSGTARSPRRTPATPASCSLVGGLALVPFSISQLFTFAFYALPDTKTPALVNIPVVALRVGVQLGLFALFDRRDRGAPG